MSENVTKSRIPALEPVRESDASERDRHYEEIGSRRGAYGDWEGTIRERRYWSQCTGADAKWLIERSRDEQDMEVLTGVANRLADIGAAALLPILDALDTQRRPEQTVALLKAAGWIGAAYAQDEEGTLGRIRAAVERYLAHPDPDVREAAISASDALPADEAARVLRSRLAVEPDPVVLETLRDAVAECESA